MFTDEHVGGDIDVAHEGLGHPGHDTDIPVKLFSEVAQRRNHVLPTNSRHARPLVRSL